MIVQLLDISKSYGDHTVLEHIREKIEDHARIGMIGVNGAGKSTLLNILSGALLPDDGQVIQSGSIGYMRQNTPLSSGASVWEEMRGVFASVLQTGREIERLQADLANYPENSLEYRRTTDRLQALTRAFEAADGYQIDVKIATVLTGLGFDKSVWPHIVDNLSGGERVRLALGKLLLEAPDLLLLDEPTNHLDFDTLRFLEKYIREYKGAVLMVSHDRYFLDHTVNEIWEIEQPELVRYAGNYTKYKTLRAERRARLLKEYEKLETKRAELADYVARNLVRASTSAMAKSRRTQLEKLEPLKKPNAEYTGMRFAFHAAHKSGFDVLSVQDLSARIGDRVLFEHIDLDIKRGEKIALVGQNGIGKTTLFRCLLQPESAGGGRISWGKNVQIGYFDQHITALDPDDMALGQAQVAFPKESSGTLRSWLAEVMLRGETVFQTVSALSGGQRAGLMLAILKERRDNVLLLDEPTNHLDLASRENLENALAEYDGTLIMISHDRYLLSCVPTAIYLLDGAGLHRFASFEQFEETQRQKQPETVRQNKPAVKANPKAERARVAALRRRISEIERQTEALEARTAELESMLHGADYQKLQAYCKEIDDNKQALAELADEWLELGERLEE